MNAEQSPGRDAVTEQLLERVRTVVLELGAPLTPDGLITIFQSIVAELEASKANPYITSSFGIVLFLDRFIVHDVLFARFLGYQPETIAEALDSPGFHRMTMPRFQFEALVKLNFIRGSRFDWHMYKYPCSDLTESLVSKLHQIDAESFVLAIEQPPQTIVSVPRLTMSRMDKFSVPPGNEKRLRFAQKKMEEVMAIFADEPPPGRCWLLYLDDKM